MGMKAVALAFEQGDDLTEAKAACRHGEFGKWLDDFFPKGWETARKYMRLAEIPKSNRDGILQDAKSLNDAFRALGIIAPEPVKQLTDAPGITIPPEIQKLNWIAEWAAREEPKFESMSPLAKEELKTKLRPVVAIYNRL